MSDTVMRMGRSTDERSDRVRKINTLTQRTLLIGLALFVFWLLFSYPFFWSNDLLRGLSGDDSSVIKIGGIAYFIAPIFTLIGLAAELNDRNKRFDSSLFSVIAQWLCVALLIEFMAAMWLLFVLIKLDERIPEFIQAYSRFCGDWWYLLVIALMMLGVATLATYRPED